MLKRKLLFIDRDGTLINEPPSQQIDSLQKLKLEKDVIINLLKLKKAGFHFVMVSNQDGLGTASFPIEQFTSPQEKLIELLVSQGINFEEILICPHFETQLCDCRKPKLGLVMHYLKMENWDRQNSYVIGDRDSDMLLANNMGIKGILYHSTERDWTQVTNQIQNCKRTAKINRITTETTIQGMINLDNSNPLEISTGIGFFDHMLEQLAKHAGFSLVLNVKGDLHIDEHHTVEDTALALGSAIKEALGDKRGIERYGFLLPMDEACVSVALDLSGRPYFVFSGQFDRQQIGHLPTELVPHFFRSLADSLGANLHISVTGENEHHKVESMFKGVGRCLKQAIAKQGVELPTTKGSL